ncbi:Uncharacterised protein [Mycobacterium tuberculosis]|uniref:Uncharacterized protein n=1 Tax=Mycobacterium tuberculosis TaxID=1773 RepID=A0A655HXM0_MYCTX|nr:Uncharacterised protein [Mycobacterium tuberculosis]CNX04338.1 Uncharacterised protein [Mycobacterium tuberculosis]COV20853.1 Uncharacterised protein [Mycobacterium tuberculosis]SGO36474.1 Uncharacterised protein [Mycobacterium tuberculosis]
MPVVDAAHNPDAPTPKRTSLPSRLPPDWSTVVCCVTPSASSRGLPLASNDIAATDIPIQMMPMMASTAQP